MNYPTGGKSPAKGPPRPNMGGKAPPMGGKSPQMGGNAMPQQNMMHMPQPVGGKAPPQQNMGHIPAPVMQQSPQMGMPSPQQMGIKPPQQMQQSPQMQMPQSPQIQMPQTTQMPMPQPSQIPMPQSQNQPMPQYAAQYNQIPMQVLMQLMQRGTNLPPNMMSMLPNNMVMNQMVQQQNVQNQMHPPNHPPIQQPPPRQEPPPKAVSKEQKENVNIRKLSRNEVVALCKINLGYFTNFLKSLENKIQGQVLVSPEAAEILMYALKSRMIYVLRQAYWYSIKRRSKILPSEPIIFDVPKARFALLEAERRAFDSGVIPGETDTQSNLDPLRNEAIYGISSRYPPKQKELIRKKAKETEDEVRINYQELAPLVPQTVRKEYITIDDIYCFLENDAIINPKRLNYEFSLQKYKYITRQKEIQQ